VKTFAKIFGAILVLVLVLGVALVVLAKILITPERVKQTVLPLAEQQLQRKVELGDIEVSLLSGIELHDLKVYESNGQELFVSADLVRLKYQLLPLLAMKVVVDEVRLEKPEIRVSRLADGRFNFSDLAGAGAKRSAAPEPADAQPSSKTPINLLVSQVRLQEGQLVFHDHVINNLAPYRFAVTGLDLAADDITLSGRIPVKLSCNLNGSPLSLDGSVDLLNQGGKLDIALQGLNLPDFKPYYADKMPGVLGSGRLDLKTTLEGSRDNIAVKGVLEVSELDLALDALPDAPFEKARVAVEHDLRFALAQGRLELTRVGVDFNGIKAETSGTLSDLLQKPVADLQLRVPGLELRQAMAAVPRSLVQGVADLDPAGTVKLEAQLAGDFAEPLKLLKNAGVTLENVQATTGGQRPSLNGRLQLTGDQLSSEDLNVRLGDNSAAIKLTARNLFGMPIVATADVSSERFLLDPLLAGGAAAGGAAGGAQPPAAAAGSRTANAELGPFDIPVRASGSIKLGETVWKGLSVKDFLAQYELRDNVLTISRMDGLVAGGSFSNTARVDLGRKGLAYDATLGLKTIQADPLLTALLPKAAGALLGKLDMDLAVKGTGTRWEAISKSLTGQGDMLVGEGRLVSPGLVQGLAATLQMGDLQEINFKNFQGNFTVNNGRVSLNSMMNGSQIKLAPKGSFGLDGSLDLSLDTRLSPELAARLDNQGRATRFLADKDGWSQVPLLLSGSFTAPRFGIDPKGVQAQAGKALQSEAERQIEKLFKQPKPATPPDGQPQEPPAEDPTQKLLKDSLKQLFGN